MGTAILRISLPDGESKLYVGDWLGTDYDKYLVKAAALRRCPGGSSIEADLWLDGKIDADQLQRLYASEKGLEEIDGQMLIVLAQVLEPYNRFQPVMYDEVQHLFYRQFGGNVRFFYGKEGSDVLYVATPWTMSELLLETDPKWNASKAYQAQRFWRDIERFEKVFDEIGYKEGKDWRYNPMLYPVGVPSSAMAVWGDHYDPSDALDVFEHDKIVFRFWVD